MIKYCFKLMLSSKEIQAGRIERSKTNMYTFEKRLGEGSFGAVWLAKDKSDKQVAIKIYSSSRLNPRAIEEIQWELNALQLLSTDQKVCQEYATCLVEWYRVGREIRVVMGYIDGPNLETYMLSIPLQERRLRTDVIEQLVFGMDQLHKLGITNQDIKEANIIWDSKANQVKYIDWGLACLKKYCDQQESNCKPPCGPAGTLYTMPPDLRSAQELFDFKQTVAHDIWSLGVVLLDWYTLDQSPGLVYYKLNPQKTKYILNAAAPKNLSKNNLQQQIQKSANLLVIELLTKLLLPTAKERLEAWPEVVKIAQLIKQPVQEPQPMLLEPAVAGPAPPAPPQPMSLEPAVAGPAPPQPTVPAPPQPTVPAPPQPTVPAPSQQMSLEKPIQAGCDPAADPSQVIVIQRFDKPDQNWCFLITDILDLKYDLTTGRFWNPYSNSWRQLDTDQQLKIQAFKQRLQEAEVQPLSLLEKAAEKYIQQLNINCIIQTQIGFVKWKTYYAQLKKSNNIQTYLRPFFSQTSLLERSSPWRLYWEFLFDSYSPTVILASVIQSILWTNNQLLQQNPTIQGGLDQNVALCKYFSTLATVSNDPIMLKNIQQQYQTFQKEILKSTLCKNLSTIITTLPVSSQEYQPFLVEWARQQMYIMSLKKQIVTWTKTHCKDLSAN
jgi:serine/threonine protein kinase